MKEHSYQPTGPIDLLDLQNAARIEHTTAEALRVSTQDYHRLGHPESVSTPEGFLLPVEPDSDLELNEIEPVHPTGFDPPPSHLGALKRCVMQALSIKHLLRRP